MVGNHSLDPNGDGWYHSGVVSADTFVLSPGVHVSIDAYIESASQWSELTFGDLIVALHGGGAGTHTKTGLSFRVSDLAAACEAAASGGGEVLQGPQSHPGEPILLARLLDTEENEFTMTQDVS